ncbi:MAG: glycosyltransferase [Verrucomicrobia bacterium]|nr:glycosyltransferase [Verrucomicrobiota bacterium]MCH8514223.1 glycosyltransferase [Kiritimatiellia bacterium]
MNLPQISIVTPSFNQAPFLEATLRSVLDQNYPRLEYIVMDGGSTDGSRDIIESHADRLAEWRSEKDGGQYNAIETGFARSTGEIMGWLNSDDMYFPWTLHTVGKIFAQFPEVDWITGLYPANWNKHGEPYHVGKKAGFNRRFFQKGLYLSDPKHPTRGCIQQESTFWRRSLWEKAGACFRNEYSLAGDFDLWLRFFAHSDLVGVGTLLAGFRQHGNQRSLNERDAYLEEAKAALQQSGGGSEEGLASWIREAGWGKRWPLKILPSMGWIQPVRNIRWSFAKQSWTLEQEWVTQ